MWLSQKFRFNSVKQVSRLPGKNHFNKATSQSFKVESQSQYNIVVLPGDGIGPEITKVTIEILKEAAKKEGVSFNFSQQLIGGAAIDETGVPLPCETLEESIKSDAVLLAAIGGSKWDNIAREIRPERGLLKIRKELEAFANLRPAIVYPELVGSSTLKPEVVSGVDLMIVRELTGDIYFGEPKGFTEDQNGNRVGFNTMKYSVPEIERIAKVAFEIAQKRQNRLLSVDKANVLETSQLWKEIVTDVGKNQYPDVELSHMYIDNAAMQLIRSPKSIDTIVTGNIFGDILSDEASMLTGSLGMLPSASLSYAGKPGLFEPVHGSAPDIANQNIANPSAMILSAAMMCRYSLDQPKIADRLEKAIRYILQQNYRTKDIMSQGMKEIGTAQMGELVGEYVATQ